MTLECTLLFVRPTLYFDLKVSYVVCVCVVIADAGCSLLHGVLFYLTCLYLDPLANNTILFEVHTLIKIWSLGNRYIYSSAEFIGVLFYKTLYRNSSQKIQERKRVYTLFPGKRV